MLALPAQIEPLFVAAGWRPHTAAIAVACAEVAAERWATQILHQFAGLRVGDAGPGTQQAASKVCFYSALRPEFRRTAGALARNAILRSMRRLGRSIWKKWSGYHRRSLVESKMRCFKLLGERVRGRMFDRQVVELQVRAALLNRFTRLGLPQTVAVA